MNTVGAAMTLQQREEEKVVSPVHAVRRPRGSMWLVAGVGRTLIHGVQENLTPFTRTIVTERSRGESERMSSGAQFRRGGRRRPSSVRGGRAARRGGGATGEGNTKSRRMLDAFRLSLLDEEEHQAMAAKSERCGESRAAGSDGRHEEESNCRQTLVDVEDRRDPQAFASWRPPCGRAAESGRNEHRISRPPAKKRSLKLVCSPSLAWGCPWVGESQGRTLVTSPSATAPTSLRSESSSIV